MDLLDNLPFWNQGASGARFILGVTATEELLYAVLIERGDESTEVVRRFSRQRGAEYGSNDPALPPPMPGTADEHEGEDFTLQFDGDADAGDGNLFLGSEFGEIEEQGSFVGDADRKPAPSFALELADILAECRDAGYHELAVVLTAPASDIRFEEIELPDVSGEPSRKQLRAALEAQYEGQVDDDRLAFISMIPGEDDVTRYLAIMGRNRDHIIATLEEINEQDVSDLPRKWMIDTELSLYLGLARSIIKRELRRIDAPEEQNTLVVRVGPDDTLVLFLRNDRLMHAEMLRSLTSFDPPETVCSRILLLQDEYEMGDMDRVLLIGEEAEDELQSSIEMFFVDAEVDPMRSYVPGADEADDKPSNVTVSATAAALRLANKGKFRSFPLVDLFPKGIIKRRFTIPFGWEVPALYFLIFVVTVFFMARFFSLESEISQAHSELAQFSDVEAVEDPDRLQAEIDSMQALSEEYMAGIAALDELLIGSDRWSQSLAEISRATAAVNGVWVESWRPGGNSITLNGNATSRDHVVQLAERTRGRIQQVVFSEIREWPVYSFEVEVDLPNELPAATRYLREQMVERLEAGEFDADDEHQPPATPASYEDE